MKYAQFMTCAILFLSSTRLLAQNRVDTPISDASSGANFVCHSSIQKISDTEWDIYRSISNKAKDHLSVNWAAAGIFCIGWAQIGPGKDAHGLRESTDYSKPKPSDVQFGLHLDHSNKARLHFVPMPHDARIESIRQRAEVSAADGKVYSIEVISALNKDRSSSRLTIRLTEGLALIVPRAAATKLRLTDEHREDIEDWLCKEYPIEPHDPISAAISEWLGLGEKGGPPAIILEMYKREQDRDLLAITTTGQNWSVQPVPLVTELPTASGGLGIIAAVYLPNDR